MVDGNMHFGINRIRLPGSAIYQLHDPWTRYLISLCLCSAQCPAHVKCAKNRRHCHCYLHILTQSCDRSRCIFTNWLQSSRIGKLLSLPLSVPSKRQSIPGYQLPSFLATQPYFSTYGSHKSLLVFNKYLWHVPSAFGEKKNPRLVRLVVVASPSSQMRPQL